MASSSTSSVQNRIFKYDVFLSFRGEDTRKTFVGHLYDALTREGIVTYKDDVDLEKGKIISKELIQAIEESRFHVIVFSKDYASSSWCLQELTKIVECQNRTIEQTVYPIFYHVEPTEVRKQIGEFGKAFAKHEKAEAAQKWRDALVQAASFSGWDLETIANGQEVEFIKIVVNKISLKLPSIGAAEDNLIGMRTRINRVVSSYILPNEFCMIGIWGMGGGGKTTLARAVFDQICNEFEGSSFVENVRECSNSLLLGLKSLQQQVLRDVFKKQDIFVNGVLEGKKEIKRKLCCRKVLIVLDDVDNIEQLRALAGDRTWFKKGSVIIITTRDEQVLRSHDVEPIQVDLLSNEEALSLFCMHAFGTEVPVQGYEELSREVVSYAAGLPLTITVLGSHLRGRSTCEWKGVLKSLKRLPKKEVVDILELSYTDLEDDIKEIFLDVACMRLYYSKDAVVVALKCCGHFEARCGLDVLKEKSLITISNDGEKVGTEATECIEYFYWELSSELFMKGLRKMKKLRYLFACTESRDEYCFSGDWEFDEVTEYIPNSLQYSEIVQLWEQGEKKILKKLKYLRIKNSKLKTLDLGMTPNLKELRLSGCRDLFPLQCLELTYIDLSHTKLRTLDLRGAPNLKSLKILCDELTELHIPAKWPKLKSFNLHDSKLTTLDLQGAQNLKELDVRRCYNLEELRMHSNCLKLESIEIMGAKLWTFKLGLTPKLKRLKLTECSHLVELQAPEDLGLLECMEELILSECTDPSTVQSMASSSISSIQNRIFKYDVFLSFRGEDTRKTFVGHLYEALTREAIVTYKDDVDLDQGKIISKELIQAIEDSRFHVIVFSKDYASSSWCLQELTKIMECQNRTTEQTLYPIFYHVEPTEVRNQIGEFGKAFAKHEKAEAAQKWRDALVQAASFSGWHLETIANGQEVELIIIVVNKISLKLPSIGVADENLVGMRTRVNIVLSSINAVLDDFCMIGIWGMEGGGKTTLAGGVFDQICNEFEGSSFVENVRESSTNPLLGLKSLQQQVLRDVFKGKTYLNGFHEGKKEMKKKMHGIKVLVVLDDVDHIDQLKALAGDRTWFKKGSVIIITTRDEQVLRSHDVELIQVNLLSNEEALPLFCMNAFGTKILVQGYKELSRDAVSYAAGLPLTITVLGSHLRGRSTCGWKGILESLKRMPKKEVVEILELSYTGLEVNIKEIFLDVACMKLYGSINEVVIALESCGHFQSRSGLDVLKEKSLITISNDGEKVVMHDQIIEMGRNIVRRPHRKEPHKHSHLWETREIEHILANDFVRITFFRKGTEATECIFYFALELRSELFMKGLRKMKRLRYLFAYTKRRDGYCFGGDWEFDEVTEYIPNSLQCLMWLHYPFSSLPKTFQANNLVTLTMVESEIVQLWKGGEKKILKKLRYIDIKNSKLKTLDLGMTPYLEQLYLEGCRDLVELLFPLQCLELTDIDLSHTKLKTLDLRGAPNLESLIIACDDLTELHIPAKWPKLKSFKLHDSKLKTLDLQGAQNLEKLDVRGCDSLEQLHIHSNCLKLRSMDIMGAKLRTFDLALTPNLKRLRLTKCSHLVELQAPEDLGLLECMEELILSECTVLRDIPNSICKMKCLRYFYLGGCVAVEKLPEELGSLECLKELNIQGTNIRHLPQSIFVLKGLRIVGFRWLLESFGFTSEIQTSEEETFCYVEL
ncbi:hypothetical protein OSB04_015909 [Centaurea solstitialis]|uniref:TIR domain-containing protein n=1 Tax=Centaurea solstitialis TaxID=347529 RepID=A0AA38SZX6_9ASTR|nr:hypothetical protein OSB04_015909 [Centaurea solstitialis]